MFWVFFSQIFGVSILKRIFGFYSDLPTYSSKYKTAEHPSQKYLRLSGTTGFSHVSVQFAFQCSEEEKVACSKGYWVKEEAPAVAIL